METSDLPSSPSLHFTYAHPDKDYLQQGDLLKKSDELNSILKDIHAYYTIKEDYTHFFVLSQTCDLIRREGECKARYITLAVVRPLEVVLNRHFEKLVSLDLARKGKIGGSKHREKAKLFTESLLNNNVNEYFYLHEENAMDFHEPSCAFLRLSISIKIEHYDACLKARFLSLDETFQAKLGWLTGNMYSRVGTEEWEARYGKQTFNAKIKHLLEQEWSWVDDKKLNQAKADIPAGLLDEAPENIRKYIKNYKIKNPRQNAIAGVLEVIQNMREEGTLPNADDATITKRLNGNTFFDSSFR